MKCNAVNFPILYLLAGPVKGFVREKLLNVMTYMRFTDVILSLTLIFADDLTYQILVIL